VALVESRQRRLLEEQKADINMAFLQARLIGEQYASVWNKNVRISKQWDIFPKLFAEEERKATEAEQQEQWESYKERRRAYAMRHNAQFKASAEE